MCETWIILGGSLGLVGRLGRHKSHRLSHGTLKLRATPPRYDIVDSDALLAWAQAQGFVRQTISTAWNVVKARLACVEDRHGAAVIDGQTGEIVPGVEIGAPSREEFSIELTR